MADLNNLFQKFNAEIQITDSKKEKMIISRENLRKKIRNYFKNNHDEYTPKFYIQGSYKMGTLIRTKDDTCDIDDGVWFDSNPDDVACTTLQTWVKNAVEGTTDDIQHRKKCITVNYRADYNIDLPVYVYDEENDANPSLAVKNGDWRADDPKEMIDAFNAMKDSRGQLLKIVRYLKAWCDYKREKMPSGLAMTVLAMNDFQTHDRDDIALKFTLIEIEKTLKNKFECIVPAIPHDDIFAEYDETRKANFLNNLSNFITDAKKATDDEKNLLKASRLWQKHLGDRFPEGENKDEENTNTQRLITTIGNSKPYYV